RLHCCLRPRDEREDARRDRGVLAQPRRAEFEAGPAVPVGRGPLGRALVDQVMTATQQLHERGQSIWLDNITRTLLTSGTLARYVDRLSVTGLTSNPPTFDKAIEGSDAYDEAIFRGVPVNVTLLFSRRQYLAAAEAYLRGIERRIAAGRDPGVRSVASLFVSRWDVAAAEMVPPELRNRLGIAVATETYAAYRELLASERWQRLHDAGACPQRL